jgi:cobalamin-dependent methionine synthase I
MTVNPDNALHAERERRPLLPIRAARERRTPITWHADDLTTPAFVGTRSVEPSLAELRRYVDFDGVDGTYHPEWNIWNAGKAKSIYYYYWVAPFRADPP